MRFVAIFKNGSVSLPYPSKEKLEANNDFRWNQLHKVISAETEVSTARLIKDALHELFLPYACACQSCQAKVLNPQVLN